MRPFRYYGGRWTRDEGLVRFMESMEMWKIKNFPHYHPFHKLYYRRGTAILKKILFFILRRTKDEGRETQDERRWTGDKRTHLPNQQQKTGNKHTQNIAQKTS